MIEARIAKWGLADQERFLLLPDEPPEHAKAGAEALEACFMETLPELASKQPDVRRPWSKKRRAFATLLDAMGRDYTFATLDELTTELEETGGHAYA